LVFIEQRQRREVILHVHAELIDGMRDVPFALTIIAHLQLREHGYAHDHL
jgi:hypothetical protein